MNDYVFNTNWTHDYFVANASQHFTTLAQTPISYLEIGVYEGQSGCWMLDHILTHPLSQYTGIDLVIRPDGWTNFQRHQDKITLIEGDSKVIVPTLHQKFDIIYIDGDHSARGALFDSVASWRLLKNEGYLLWDDYLNSDKGCQVEIAVQSFLRCLPKNFYRIFVDNNQFGVIKLRD